MDFLAFLALFFFYPPAPPAPLLWQVFSYEAPLLTLAPVSPSLQLFFLENFEIKRLENAAAT